MKALWNYSRYEVVPGTWRGIKGSRTVMQHCAWVVGTGRTRGKAEEKIEGSGARVKTPNARVQGHMDWIYFETREASSKLRGMDKKRWASKVFRFLYRKSVDTGWRRRTRRPKSKYVFTP